MTPCFDCGLRPRATGRSYCPPCNVERVRRWRQAHPDKYREQTRRRDRSGESTRKSPEENRRTVCRRYGLTVEQYDERLEAQGGVCAICSAPPTARALAIDHNHETGRVRGLLCANCNTALGKMRDDPALLRAAAAYVEDV